MLLSYFRVDANLDIKIGDFGLCKENYIADYYTATNTSEYSPVRWMAPECLKRGRFSHQSDVVTYLRTFATNR